MGEGKEVSICHRSHAPFSKLNEPITARNVRVHVMLWKSSLNHHTFHCFSAHFLIVRARVVGAVSINTHQPDDVLEAPCDSTPSSDFIYVYYIGEIIRIIHHLTYVNKSVFVRISVIPESVENVGIG